MEETAMTEKISAWKSALRQTGSLGLAIAVCFSPVRAQDTAEHKQSHSKHTMYRITDLDASGSPFSQGFYVNQFGAVGGIELLPDGNQHAFIWKHGTAEDLGTLGGNNRAIFGSPNSQGQAAGEAETSTHDPQGEDFCGFGTHLTCSAVLWESGKDGKGAFSPLPTLHGGVNSQGTWLTNFAEIAGASENGKKDASCPSGVNQVQEFKPVVWFKPFSWFAAQIFELPTPKGDPDGIALSINDKGHVVGTTGSCGPFNPNQFTNISATSPEHAVLWKDGKMIELKSLGGLFANTAFAINNLDQVVGVSDVEGDANFKGFLWENGKTTALEPLNGDTNSVALGINHSGQIVGLSLDANFAPSGAILWENGNVIDLSTLATSDSNIVPLAGEWINAKGEIAGWGLDAAGDIHAFLAVPVCDGDEQPHANRPRIHMSSDSQREIMKHIRMGKSGLNNGPQ
jgi:probable HAF family extracellular repeat protein